MRIDFSIAKPVFLCDNGDNTFLINLHNAVNFPYKPVAGEEPDSPCHQEEAEDHDAGVAEVEEG